MKKILLILVSIFTGYILTSCTGQLKAGTAALTNPLHEELVPGCNCLNRQGSFKTAMPVNDDEKE